MKIKMIHKPYIIRHKHLKCISLGISGIFQLSLYTRGFILSFCKFNTIYKRYDFVLCFKPFSFERRKYK